MTWLNAHDTLRRKPPLRSVDVAPEVHAVLIDVAQSFEGEDLKSTGIGEDRSVPLHELVQAPELANQLVAGTEVQVVGIRQDHLRAHRVQVVGVEGLDGCERADRHEGRRLHHTMWRVEARRACAALGLLEGEFECGHAAH
jgi:hypothetical protein